MEKLKFIGIIPARYASSRFPGKPLAMISGKTMIQRVYEQVEKVLSDVYVATDDSRISSAVESFGGKAVMTSDKHRSGTDRCYEAYCNIGSDADVVINIQGDEPFIHEEQIRGIMDCFGDPATQIATLVRKFDPKQGFDSLADSTKPKVVVDGNRNALYFSRSVIPFVRNAGKEDWASETVFYMHVGMYAYKAEVLAEITKLPQSPLELAESLEQLRWLQAGYKIKTGLTDKPTIGIDTPTDLDKAIKYLSAMEK